MVMARSKGFFPLKTRDSIPLGALAADTVIKETSPLALTEDYFVISTDVAISWRNGTAGQGPIQIGWANNDLSVTEIAEALDAAPVNRDDVIGIERMRRPVRIIGNIDVSTGDGTIGDGEKIKTVIRKRIGSSIGQCFWARNRSGATLTTGNIVQLDGMINGRWL